MLVWILAGLAVAIVPFILVALNAQRKYRPLFDDAHLVEVAELLARLKGEADADGVASVISSHDLAITWDASRPEIALSHRDGKLHQAAGAFLARFTVALISPPPEAEVAFTRAHGRYVVRLALPPEAGAAFRAAPVTVPALADLPPLRARAADAMRTTRFEPA
ncbi:MAG: hypothetical protein CVU56_27585 [Deltaproteobacteria bacterium HGW-Deltaproteobacteria-14]|jgi:hypothetical protein|nr:MAG: hypothetical protein CVU56_27585 [Deltaproteobacteria bacterium HGW-Deltaproteobacteria-14]